MEDPISNLRAGLGEPLNSEQSYRMPNGYQNAHNGSAMTFPANGYGDQQRNFTMNTQAQMHNTNYGGGYKQSNMMSTTQSTQMMNLPYASEQPTVIAPNDSRIDVLEGLGESSRMYNNQSMN